MQIHHNLFLSNMQHQQVVDTQRQHENQNVSEQEQ